MYQFVYILLSKKDKKFYTGYTKNLKLRFEQHNKGLVERLGDATEESHHHMQAAVDEAFPQALGMFEILEDEDKLVQAAVFPGNDAMKAQWLERITPVLISATLTIPAVGQSGLVTINAKPDEGGRRKDHSPHLKQLVDDLQQVYRIAPTAKW